MKTTKNVIEVSVIAKGVKIRCRKSERHYLATKKDFDAQGDEDLPVFYEENFTDIFEFAKKVIETHMKTTLSATICLSKIKVELDTDTKWMSRQQAVFCSESNYKIEINGDQNDRKVV